jgi:DNA-binding transcriptional ArsR family regulator
MGLTAGDAGRLDAVRDAMPAPAAVEETAEIFALLGDPGRLTLLLALVEAGELCVSDLAETCGMEESRVSHALRLLRAHRVVAARRQGRSVHYRLEDAHVRMLLDLAVAHADHEPAIPGGVGTATRPRRTDCAPGL